MKKLFIFCPALLVLSLSACIDTFGPMDPPSNERILSIESFYPESAICGSEIAIYGENFGETIMDNYVTFNYPDSKETETGWASELILLPRTGLVLVRVPENLNPGDYTISLHTDGQTCRSKKPFKIINAKSPGS